MILYLKSGTFSFYYKSVGTAFCCTSIQYMFVFHTTCYFCDNRMRKV